MLTKTQFLPFKIHKNIPIEITSKFEMLTNQKKNVNNSALFFHTAEMFIELSQ